MVLRDGALGRSLPCSRRPRSASGSRVTTSSSPGPPHRPCGTTCDGACRPPGKWPREHAKPTCTCRPSSTSLRRRLVRSPGSASGLPSRRGRCPGRGCSTGSPGSRSGRWSSRSSCSRPGARVSRPPVARGTDGYRCRRERVDAAAPRGLRGARIRGRLDRALLIAVAAALALDLVAATAPVSSADALAYHLGLPKLWLQQGSIGHPFWRWEGFNPSGIEMLYTRRGSRWRAAPQRGRPLHRLLRRPMRVRGVRSRPGSSGARPWLARSVRFSSSCRGS